MFLRQIIFYHTVQKKTRFLLPVLWAYRSTSTLLAKGQSFGKQQDRNIHWQNEVLFYRFSTACLRGQEIKLFIGIPPPVIALEVCMHAGLFCLK